MAVLARALSFLARTVIAIGMVVAGFGLGLAIVGEGLRGKHVRDWLSDLIDAFRFSDERTWIGHGIWGLAFGVPSMSLGLASEGYALVLGMFIMREVVPRVEAWLAGAPVTAPSDGWMDLVSPHMGFALGGFLVAFLGPLLGAAWAIVVFVVAVLVSKYVLGEA